VGLAGVRRLRRVAVVVPEDPPEPVSPPDRGVGHRGVTGERDEVPDTLVVPLAVVVLDTPKVRLAERDVFERHSLLIDRTNRSAYAFRFGERAGRRTTSTPLLRNSAANCCRIEGGGPIVNQISYPSEEPIECIGEIACHLSHPDAVASQNAAGRRTSALAEAEAFAASLS